MGAKTLLSLEEYMALPEDGNKYELDQGELVVMPMPKSDHSLIIQYINHRLSVYVLDKSIGWVFSEAAYLLKGEPESIARQPDVSFLSLSRVKATPRGEYFAGAPELAVEVVSPGNQAEELDIKVNQYLAYGSKEVWVVYPKTRSILIHQPGGRVRKLIAEDTITSDLFPAWSARVADFFDLDY
jgi:Uma2 family endonuclease